MSVRSRNGSGKRSSAREDRRLLTRGGHFIDDLTLPGVAHAAYVRSPHARARIRRIDVRRALDHPGVYAAITGDDVASLTRPQRGRVPLANSPKVYALAYQQVRYVGEPVVGIAAVDRATAEDAADLVEVEYDPLPPVIEPEEALKPDAPLVFEEVGSNILWHDTFPYGDVEGAFAAGGHGRQRARDDPPLLFDAAGNFRRDGAVRSGDASPTRSGDTHSSRLRICTCSPRLSVSRRARSA